MRALWEVGVGLTIGVVLGLACVGAVEIGGLLALMGVFS